jgi:hypothetical protein
MPVGELLAKLTIWMALGGYTVGASALLLARRHPGLRRWARPAWTFGCAWFLAHVFCAFNYYYDWSHTTAYLETARQTAEVRGTSSGGGIFVSYAFTLAWVGDVLWWWLSPRSHEHRPRLLTALLHGFFFFIIVNGTVVFESGPARLLGVAICAVLLVSLWAGRPVHTRDAHELKEVEG